MSFARRAALAAGVALTAAVTLPAAALAAAPAPPAAAPAALRTVTDVTAQDRQWMVAAHQSNLTEIAAGTAAQQKATTDKVRRLGTMFKQMHTQQDAQLRAAARTLGVDLPGAPNAQQRAALAAVSAESGAAFDAAWIAQQTTSHRQTLAATDQQIANGSNDTALRLARASRPVVAAHLAELTGGGSGSPTSIDAGTGGQAATDGAMPGLALTGLGVLLVAAAGGVLVARRRSA
jgi:putative membrane protein